MKRQTPKYQLVEQRLALEIHKGRYKTRLPGERVLAQEYQVSYMTLRKAIENLVAKGLLYKIPAQGVYVCVGPSPVLSRQTEDSDIPTASQENSIENRCHSGSHEEQALYLRENLADRTRVSALYREIFALRKANKVLQDVVYHFANRHFGAAAFEKNGTDSSNGGNKSVPGQRR